jgi:hypothetical protein
MQISNIRVCQCAICQHEADHPEKNLHRMINLIVSQLDEQQRRWFVALEANQVGYGGVRLLSQITGMDEKTIHRGQLELEQGLASRPSDRVRLEGGGRRLIKHNLLEETQNIFERNS